MRAIKKIYRYISASREIEAEGGMLPPPASLSWVLMYDLKPKPGAAAVRASKWVLSGIRPSPRVGSFSINSHGCKLKQGQQTPT